MGVISPKTLKELRTIIEKTLTDVSRDNIIAGIFGDWLTETGKHGIGYEISKDMKSFSKYLQSKGWEKLTLYLW